MEALLRAIPARLTPSDASSYRAQVLDPILKLLEDASDHILIQSTVATQMYEPLKRYQEHLAATLGHPDPVQAPELDEAKGIDPIEAKYGAGLGWQFYCATDLLQACERSQKTGEPICFTWD